MAGLQGTTTLTGDLSDLQKQIGGDYQQANTNNKFYTTLQSQLDTQQQSVSGVSLDEELVNMLQFQQTYQAAAKMISKTSDLLMAVIGMVH